MASQSNPSPPTDTPFPLKLTCHCARITVSYPSKPPTLNECHCTVCYKYGVLWGYFPPEEVTITESDGATVEAYIRSDEDSEGDIAFKRCSHCGCVVVWMAAGKWEGKGSKMGVNFRMVGWKAVEGIPRRFGGKE